MKFYFAFLILFLSLPCLFGRETVYLTKPRVARQSHNHFSIVIGSDYIPDSHNVFQTIKTHQNPDLFIWAGTIVDAEIDESLDDLMKMDIGYQNFKKTTPVNAVFNLYNDLHDRYDFIGEPKESRRRKSSGSYESFLLKSDYFAVGKYVKIIMVDIQEDSKRGIGVNQMDWIKRELNVDPSIVMILIVSNDQIMSNEKYIGQQLPNSVRMEFYKALSHCKTPILMASTGWLPPFAEIMKHPCTDTGRTLYEVTTTGLNFDLIEEAPLVNKLFSPEVYSQYKERVFKANYVEFSIVLDKDNDLSKVFIGVYDSMTGQALKLKLVTFRELRWDAFKVNSDLSCMMRVNKDMWKFFLRNLAIVLLSTPELRFKVISFLLFWTAASIYIIYWMLKRSKGSSRWSWLGYGGYLNEFEKFHSQ